MDGTSLGGHCRSCTFSAPRIFCHQLGRDFTPADFAATFGRRNPEIFAILFGDTLSAADMARFGDRKEEAYRRAARAAGVKLLPGVRTLVEALHAAGFGQAIGSRPHRGPTST